MILLNYVKGWLWAILSAVLAVLGVTSVYFRGKAKRLAQERDSLKATVHAERVRKRIEKEKKKVLEEDKKEIKKEIKEKGSYEGLGSNDDY